MTRRRRLRPLKLAVAGLLLIVLVGLGSRAGHALIVNVPIETPDVIVSLGSHEWERLPIAIRQAQLYRDALVLLTVPPAINERNCYRCGERVEELRHAGIAADRVRVLPLEHASTYGEAQAVASFLTSHPGRRVLIVTSPYHTRRALATFRTALDGRGIEVGVLPAMLRSTARPGRWWVAGYDRWYVTHEWAGLVYYGVKHGVWRW